MHFKIPNTKRMPGTFEDRWDEGLWLDFDMRSEENLIGTSIGVFKVATVQRKPIDERWSPNRLTELQGSPKQPAPNQANRRMPAYSVKHRVQAQMMINMFLRYFPKHHMSEIRKYTNKTCLIMDRLKDAQVAGQSSEDRLPKQGTPTNVGFGCKTSSMRVHTARLGLREQPHARRRKTEVPQRLQRT